MYTALGLLPPLALDINAVSCAEIWNRIEVPLNDHYLAMELDNKKESRQVVTLLTVIGEDAREVYYRQSTGINWMILMKLNLFVRISGLIANIVKMFHLQMDLEKWMEHIKSKWILYGYTCSASRETSSCCYEKSLKLH